DAPPPLSEFGYGDVELAPGPAQTQFEQTQSVLLSLNDDSLLKPWRIRAGLPAPGPNLGGWYDEVPLIKTEGGGNGFAPAHCFGQWISALSRGYAVNGDVRTRAKVQRLLDLYSSAISPRFYANFRFPGYDYDKMVIGLIDAHQFGNTPQAFTLLDRTTDAAEQHLPPHALDRDEPQRRWRASVGDNTTDDYCWDEYYTMPENLYLAWERGAGERYRQMAGRYLLDETWFDPLSENRNVLADHHAYSFCNSLSSAMQAYIATGSQKHLRAATNAFDMITATQSFATGGWGPNESFSAPGSGKMYASLTGTHNSFETPCGSYAHFKLTRYLLRVTGNARYGDSMERVLYNTVLGAKRLEPDGHAFYYSDYNFSGSKVYHPDAWPCCSGTLPQVAADYRILTYFHDPAGVYVNLYLPSTLKWTAADGAQLTLTQGGKYPIDGKIGMTLRASRPSEFAMRLRIPAWALTHTIRVNGAPSSAPISAGFATLRRRWKDGDHIELELPMPMRLEAIDPEHPDTVALVRGPLVLFAVTEESPKVTRQQLLAASPVSATDPGKASWQAQTASGSLRFLPFTAIADERYTTYMTLN
ncbi:MAG TPA: beta-L-arabinofuranosidase domain-containing protein, partial [Silvibacterium sp.]|nr:beta-L-arabinofuranosidase domain-containing protein [Silvibacterium sp.]